MNDSISTIEKTIDAGQKKGVIKSKVNAKMLAGIFMTQYFTTVVLREFIDSKHLTEGEFVAYFKDMLKVE